MTAISYPNLEKKGLELGLDALGIVQASESRSWPIFAEWADSGQAGGMNWLTSQKNTRRHPDSVLKGVQTLLVGILTLEHLQKFSAQPQFPAESDSSVQNRELLPYSVCIDYHTVLKLILKRLSLSLKEKAPGEKCRVAVDTAPLLEKEWGERAGLGRIARNSLLLHPQFGTEIFLGTLLTTIPFESFTEVPTQKKFCDPCSNCDRCIKACPVNALNPNRTLNASKCLNYWTIEYQGAELPDELKKSLGNRLFGCDTCRRVCPHNRFIPSPALISAEQVSNMTNEEFQIQFSGTPLERLGLEKFKRNCRI